MDLTNPARSLCAPVPADVLVVLERSHTALTGATVARLAGRSYAQVQDVLHRLAENGLVDAAQAGQARLYTLNREHVLAPAVTAISTAHRTLADRMTEHVKGWKHPPINVSLFGSAARRDGTPTSDIDILFVRPDRVSIDDEAWLIDRRGLVRNIDRWSGNSAQAVELSLAELADAIRRQDSLISSLAAESLHVAGSTITELLDDIKGK